MQRSTHHRSSPCLALAAAALTLGLGCKPGDPKGIRVECKSNGKNTYTKYYPNHRCLDAQGNQFIGCKHPAPVENLGWCYGPEEWLANDDGGETGTAEPGEGIDRRNWPTHEPSLAYIKDRCTSQCTQLSPHDPYVCDPDDWTIFGIDKKKLNGKYLATQLGDPGELTCPVPDAKPYMQGSPVATTVIPPGTTAHWSLDGQPIALSCSNLASCSGEFDQSVLMHLQRAGNSPPGPNESEADYLASSSAVSGSRLTLEITNSGGASHDSHWVGGRIEYSAADCQEATCPIYLGNLTVTNAADTWTLYSDWLLDGVEVTNLTVQLRHPVLGVWCVASGEVYFAAEVLEFEVDYDMAIGGGSPVTITNRFRNEAAVYGTLRDDGSIDLRGLAVGDGELRAHATIDYDIVEGHPPSASFALPEHVRLDSNEFGLKVSSIVNTSSDLNNDLYHISWVVDGEYVAPEFVIEPGRHTVRLEARDSRLAYDHHEQDVTISH